MMKHPDELIEERREEILEAFFQLYETTNFNNLNVKVISESLRFSRATIYNYFKNIDEIFMAAYQKEYLSWANELEEILNGYEKMSVNEFADIIATSLEKHENMLRLSTVNFHEREENCRKEIVFSQKAAFSKVVRLFHDLLVKFFPQFSEDEIIERCYEFFPFMHGMYRYIDITPIQEEAIKANKLLLTGATIHDLSYKFIVQILK